MIAASGVAALPVAGCGGLFREALPMPLLAPNFPSLLLAGHVRDYLDVPDYRTNREVALGGVPALWPAGGFLIRYRAPRRKR